MKILAIESAQATVSVAVAEEDGATGERRVIGEYTINGTKDHSQTLLPAVETLCARLGLDAAADVDGRADNRRAAEEHGLASIDAVAVSGGPGSFTGLRIGSATAKGLAYSLGVPMVHIPTPDLMAYGLWGTDALICPLMDARNRRVFTGLYRFGAEGSFEVVRPAFAAGAEELAEILNGYQEKVLFTGDGIPAVRALLEETLTVEHAYAPAHLAHPRAAACAVLAMDYVRAGKTVTAAEEVPDYLRASQAEREFQKRTGMTVEEAARKAREES